MREDRNWSPEQGNPEDWSTEGWTAEWRRIGLEWWQYRIFDPNGNLRSKDWVDYGNAFYTNLLNKIRSDIQYWASIDAQNVAEIRRMSLDEIITEAKSN
ncbi:hypothetical protein SEA_FAUST_233 [Streptomyces phage Faust]|uniref:Uncharacterized protein n=1 Tax=Streptomyces phage Faust TaxID=2767565 RepID=A0A7G9UZ50_9CAUD|nr:hypothetical protein PP456_gp054 [Streptomyces phage Faust]QNN99305.1 hypothetical protein SEA_FAUST_233 [Streptomyces phage Faust]